MEDVRAHFDEVAESSVIGSLLWRQDDFTIVNAIIQGHDKFYSGKFRRIYQACEQLNARGVYIDTTTVASELRNMGHIAGVGGSLGLHEILNEQPVYTQKALLDYCRTVFQKWHLRQLRLVLDTASARIENGIVDVTEFLDSLEKDVSEKTRSRLSNCEPVLLKDAANAVLADIVQRMKDQKPPPSLSTGFPSLDGMIRRLRPGTLTIIAGRPGTGKTALAMNIAEKASIATLDGIPQNVIFFTKEMSNSELALREMSAFFDVDGGSIAELKGTPKDVAELTRNLAQLSMLRLFFVDNANISFGEIKAMVQQLRYRLQRSKEDVGLVIVDYLQLFRGIEKKGGKFAASREQEVAELSREFKIMSREFNVPVIVLSQLNREVEKRGGSKIARPKQSDLRESGAIEQDADTIIFIHRDTMPPEPGENGFGDAKNKDYVGELIVAKARGGTTGIVPVSYNGSRFRFLELDTTDESPGGEWRDVG